MPKRPPDGEQPKMEPGGGGGRRALIVVDVQRDFALAAGSLPVPGAEAILAPLDDLIGREFERPEGRYAVCAFSKDHHPAEHVSFAASHPGREPFSRTQVRGRSVDLWPVHCVQGTPGNEIVLSRRPGTVATPPGKTVLLIEKGTCATEECYSAFAASGAGDGDSGGLAAELARAGTVEVDVVGLALDYCVRATALDAVKAGFDARVLLAYTRAVDATRVPAIVGELQAAGAAVISEEP